MYGTASKHKHEFIKNMGAIPIDYKHENFTEVINKHEPEGVDFVFDPIGGSYFKRSLSILKKKGTLLAYGYQNAASGIDGNVVLDYFKVKWWNILPNRPSTVFYVITALRKQHPEWFKEDLAELFKLLSAHKIKPVIGKIMPLEQAAEAHDLVENYKIQGKVILKINDE